VRSTGDAAGRGSAFASLVDAINEVDRLRRLGVRGAALTRAIERIGRQLNLLAPNRPLFATLLGSAVLPIGLLAVPVLRRLGLARLDFLDLLASVAGATLPYIANEAAKLRGAARRSNERADQRRGLSVLEGP